MLNSISSTLSLKSELKSSKNGVRALGLEYMQPFETWDKLGECVVQKCNLISAWLFLINWLLSVLITSSQSPKQGYGYTYIYRYIYKHVWIYQQNQTRK